MNEKKMGALIRELREERKLTQEELAENIGVKFDTISRWENAKNLPSIVNVQRMCDFFEISINELIEGERKTDIVIEEKEELKNMAAYADKQNLTVLERIQMEEIMGLFICVMELMLIDAYMTFEKNYFIYLQIIMLIAAVIAIICNIFRTHDLINALKEYRKKKNGILLVQIILGILTLILII